MADEKDLKMEKGVSSVDKDDIRSGGQNPPEPKDRRPEPTPPPPDPPTRNKKS